jgi:hypothetical protein
MSGQIILKALIVGFGVVGITCWGPGIWAKPSPSQISHLQIPILGTSVNTHHLPMGLVSQIVIDLYERRDQDGLQIQFHTEPGEFSLFARQSIHQAIIRALQAANLHAASWTVQLKFPYAGLTVYGESLSAMVALSVVAMAKGEPPLEGQLKILAAYHQHFQRVFVPSVYDERDGDWRTPFLMHVSPVSTVEEAYLGLTGHQLTASP